MWEDDGGKAFAKAPAAVQGAAKKLLGEKKMEEFDKEVLDGKDTYEVGYKVGDVDHAYVLSATGELLHEEADVEVSKLPEAVTAAVKKALPEGTIKEAAEGDAAGKHLFFLDVKVGKVGHVVSVAADGTIAADQKVTADEEEDDDEKEEKGEHKK